MASKCPVCGTTTYGPMSPAQAKGFLAAGKTTCFACATSIQVIYDPEGDCMHTRVRA